MKKSLSHTLFSLLAALFVLLAASPAWAQTTSEDTGTGKGATVITMDENSCGKLWAQNATSTNSNVFGFLRHKQAPVQLISSNSSRANTFGVFASVDNNLEFPTQGSSSLKVNSGNSGQYCYLGIIAPKGYRFSRYVLDIDQANSSANATITEYTYVNGTVVDLANKVSVSKGSTEALNFDVTKEGEANKLFFRFDMGTTGDKLYVYLKSLKLYYIIDSPYPTQVPDAAINDNVRTDEMDLGTFYSNGTNWVFNTQNISDRQNVGIYYQPADGSIAKVDKPDHITTDGSDFFVAHNGDYYIEGPARYRIVGANINFLSRDFTPNGTATVREATTIVAGQSYVISDGNGHYLNADGFSLSAGTDAEQATLWTAVGHQDPTEFSFRYGDDKYLELNGNNLSLNEGPSSGGASWQQTWIVSNNRIYSSYYYNIHTSNGRSYYYNPRYRYLTFNEDYHAWGIVSSDNNTNIGNARLQTVTTTGGTTYSASNYTGEVYDKTGKSVVQTVTVTPDDETVNSVELTDLNNDAIHIRISGLEDDHVALFSVNLGILPLNPEVQTVSIAAKNGNYVTGNTSVSSENFKFSDVTLAITGDQDAKYDIVFRHAYNFSRTKWYTSGSLDNDESTKGYSNYYLVGSDADQGTTVPSLNRSTTTGYPEARNAADQVGTTDLKFSNIDELIANKETTLHQNSFSKTEAGYQTVTLGNGESQTVHLYAADEPTYLIMPSGASTLSHIDYRYYTVNVKLNITQEVPQIEITPLYTTTLKGAPHKTSSTLSADNEADAMHTYIGVKVTSSGDGYLSSQSIIDALNSALATNNYYGFGADDPYRGILYMDMSSLNTVSDALIENEDGSTATNTYWDDLHTKTADNCLYFMYPGYQRGGITNTIAGNEQNGFEAVSNIVVRDQQPFYSPYNFVTGTYTASYTRESTHGKSMVSQMSSILPFDIQLDEQGHPYRASDAIDKNVTFNSITESGKEVTSTLGPTTPYGYAVVVDPVQTKGIDADNKDKTVAEANKPYHVTTKADGGGFSFNLTNARFHQTPALNGGAESDMSYGVNSSWIGHGTYAGKVVGKADNLYIFSSNRYHKTGAQTQNQVFYVLPFRAYFETDAETASKATVYSVVTNRNDVVTGIEDVTADRTAADGLAISAGQGTITVTAGQTARVNIFTTSGQQVAGGILAGGQTATYSVPQGIYVVNHVKVVVK